MFCPSCGKPCVPNSAFCMSCGRPLALASAPPKEGRTVGTATPQRKGLWPTVISLLLAIAVLLGAAVYLAAPAKVAPAAVFRVSAQGMPADVYAWLKHLEETEHRRRALVSKQATDLLMSAGLGVKADLNDAGNPESTTDPNHPPSLEKLAAAATAAKQEWMDLVDFFNSKSPPTECVPIRDEFDQTLRETASELGDVSQVLAGGEADPEASKRKLDAMKGTSAKSIDSHGLRTDQLVGDLCRKYQKAKWFDIAGDIGGGNSLMGTATGVPLPSIPSEGN